jgi:thioredoxin reductase
VQGRRNRSGRWRQFGRPGTVFLRNFAKKIWMLVREPSLAESMSQYLIDRICAIDNIEVLTPTEIIALYGSREKQLERVRWRNNVTAKKPRNRSATSFSSSARSRPRPGSGTSELPWTTRTSF